MVGHCSLMDSLPSIIISLIGVFLALGISGGTFWVVFRQRPAMQAVSGCDEQLKAMEANWKSEQEKHRETEKRLTDKHRETEQRLTGQVERNRELAERMRYSQETIVALTRALGVVMDRMGIPVPTIAPVLPRKERLTFIGVWAEQASLPTLDLRSDLEGVLQAGNWEYRPLTGKVTGKDLEYELNIEGGADILYIAAHADQDGIYFSDQKYPPEWLGEVAARYGVKLVVLNACLTRDTARVIVAKGVPSVVYTMRNVEDRVAIEFAKAFFFSFAIGHSVVQSVESAQRAVTRFGELNPRAVFGFYGDWKMGKEVF